MWIKEVRLFLAMGTGPGTNQRSTQGIWVISIQKIQELVQRMLCKLCCRIGYNDGHTPVAIWNQTLWFLLCSTETHIWKTPVPHFSALPVPTQTKYRVEVFGSFWVYFLCFLLCQFSSLFYAKKSRKLSAKPEFLLTSWSLSSSFCSLVLPTQCLWCTY